VSGTQKSPNGDPVPGSINEVAEEINKLGGKGIAVAVDLADDKQIRGFEQRRPVVSQFSQLAIIVFKSRCIPSFRATELTFSFASEETFFALLPITEP
jgi:hypothetical protein